jgi:long-chain fatty acid transport protein
MPHTAVHRLSPLFSLLILASSASAAEAGGFTTARFGGESGHPANGHPTSIYYNPAGISLGHGTRIYAEGLFAFRQASYERPADAISNVIPDGESGAGTPEDLIAANAGKGELSEMLVAPFASVTSDLGIRNLGVGVAVYAPFGGQSSWDQNSDFAGNDTVPGAVDGVQRWHVIEGTLRAVYFTGAAAYHIPAARLSLGAGVNVVRSQVETVRGRNAAGTDDILGPNGEVLEGRSLIDVSGTDLSIGVGAIWQPTDNLWLGASYQSQPGFGDQELAGTLTNKFGTGPTDTSDIRFIQALPDIVRVGARVRARPDLELRLQADYQRWSVLDDQCLIGTADDANCSITDSGAIGPDGSGVIVNIKRDWRDTFGVRGGGSYWLNPQLEVGASIGYDSNAVPDATLDSSLMDMDKVLANATVSYALSGLSLSASFLQVFYFQRDIAAQMEFDQPSRVPNGAGTYNQSVSVVTLGAEYAF